MPEAAAEIRAPVVPPVAPSFLRQVVRIAAKDLRIEWRSREILATMLVLGTIGFAAVGCVFSAALLRSRSRDVLLATLLYPIIVPIVIAGARGTAQLIDPLSPDLDGARFWTQFLVAVDVIFVTLG